MTDTTTPRVTTERARELVEAATPGPWSCHQHPRGKSLARLEFGDIQIRGWSVWVDGLDEHLADAALISAAPDLAADLIDARERIAALEAERDARVTVEEHAREIRGVFWRQYDCDTRATPFWMVSKTRADLIATLTRHVGPKLAAELADGVGGDS